jgi:hypothetical protein
MAIGLSIFAMAGPKIFTQVYAQDKNETSEAGMKNMSMVTTNLIQNPK